MSGRFVMLPAVVAILAGSLWALASIGPARESPRPSKAEASEAPEGPPGRVASSEMTHNFGEMSLMRKRSHTFTVRNVGAGTLTLRKLSTSCGKCTECEVLDREIPPGGEGRVQVTWTTKDRTEHFRHWCTVETNDPEARRLRLRIRGRVTRHLAAEPGSFYATQVEQQESRSMTSLVFSEHWDSFRLDDFETDLMGLAWEIELAGSERLAKLPHALSGKVLRVTLPAGMPAGDFSYDLRFKAYPQGAHAGDEPLSSSMKVHGSVLSRLSVRGPHMSGGREIRFGPVAEGAGLAERYLVKVRGEEQELALARYASRPDFIKAELAPYRSEVDGETKPGLYRLTLSIPKDAPPCTHPPTKPATVRLYFDHPGIEMYELTLTFSIIAKD